MDVTVKDFYIVSQWKVDRDGPNFDPECGEIAEDLERKQFIIDETTGRRYVNESVESIRCKCFLLIFGTPFMQPLFSIGGAVYAAVDVCKERSRWRNLVKRLEEVVVTPFALLGLEFAAMYGVARPLDGRKLYATIERAVYGERSIVASFQPEREYQAVGGWTHMTSPV